MSSPKSEKFIDESKALKTMCGFTGVPFLHSCLHHLFQNKRNHESFKYDRIQMWKSEKNKKENE